MALIWGAMALPQAHDVPGQVLAQILAKAEGNRMRLLVRVPLVAMQDMDFPTHGPDYLNISDAEPSLRQSVATQVANGISVYENGVRLGGQETVTVMASLPSNRSFVDFDQALAHIRGPRLADNTDIVWQQVMLDVLFEYPIQSAQSAFAIEPALARLGQRTETSLRYVRPDGVVRSFDVRGNPGILYLDPTMGQAVGRFVSLGFWHVLDGVEQLLFLACLVIPIRRLRPLVASVASFAIAHTVTLTAAALNFTPAVPWFPPLIDALVAVSIAYLAFENALGAAPKRRWLVAFIFGLVHGYAFSFALRETLQFAGGHTLLALIAFNIGLTIGQFVMAVALAAVASALFLYVIPARAGTIMLSGLVAHTAWHWILTRGGVLRLYDLGFGLPSFNRQLLGPSLRWGVLLTIVLVLIWMMSRVFPQLERSDREDKYA